MDDLSDIRDPRIRSKILVRVKTKPLSKLDSALIYLHTVCFVLNDYKRRGVINELEFLSFRDAIICQLTQSDQIFGTAELTRITHATVVKKKVTRKLANLKI